MSNPRTILITGATDGIGLALARHYLAQGDHRLVLVGRRDPAELDDAIFTPARYCRVDLAQPDCAERVVDWLAAQGIDRLELAIMNAGAGYVGTVARQPAESVRGLLAVNLEAPMRLTHALMPLLARAGGDIAYVGSVASALPGPDYAVYTATKAALDGFVRNLRIELAAAGSPVRARLLLPGATRTGMHVKSGLPAERINWDRFADPAHVAAAMARSLEGRRRQVTIGRLNGLARWVGRNLPGLMDSAASRRAGPAPEGPPPEEGSRHAVITGAADGIGRALAFALAGAGYQITGVDVDMEQAMRTQAELINAGHQARFLPADLADPTGHDRLLDGLRSRPPVDLLVHNAGINAVGAFVEQPLDQQLRVLEVNLAAPLLLTRSLLAAGHIREESGFVFISSLSHYVSYPGAAVYAASKDGIASYARSLRTALSPYGYRVLTVFPGPTRTAHARRYSPDNRREARRMAPETLAAQVVSALEKRRTRLIPGAGNRLAAVGGRLLPDVMEQLMRRTILDKLE